MWHWIFADSQGHTATLTQPAQEVSTVDVQVEIKETAGTSEDPGGGVSKSAGTYTDCFRLK